MRLSEIKKKIDEMAKKINIKDNEHIRLIELFYGAYYSLKRAKELEYEDHEIVNDKEYEKRIEEHNKKVIDELTKSPFDNDDEISWWTSKYFFNNVLHRISAIYDRVLKVLILEKENGEKEKIIEKLNCRIKGTDCWSKYLKKLMKESKFDKFDEDINRLFFDNHIEKIRNEVNNIKHDMSGTTKRKVKFDEAKEGLEKLFEFYKKYSS